MPEMGVKMPIRTREDGGMRSTVFPKRTAVEVMVVKPIKTNLSIGHSTIHTQKKESTIRKQEPRGEIYESVLELSNLAPAQHVTEFLPSSSDFSPKTPFFCLPSAAAAKRLVAPSAVYTISACFKWPNSAWQPDDGGNGEDHPPNATHAYS